MALKDIREYRTSIGSHIYTPKRPRPNKPLELTPLRVEAQDQPDFENQIWLDCFPTLSGRRSSAASRYAVSARLLTA